MESVAIEVHSAPLCDAYSECAPPTLSSGFDISSSTLDADELNDFGALCSEILLDFATSTHEYPSNYDASLHSLDNFITTKTPGDAVKYNRNKNGRYIVFPNFTCQRSLVKPVLRFELPQWGYTHPNDVPLRHWTNECLIADNVQLPEPTGTLKRHKCAIIKVFDQGIECASLKLKMVHQSYASSAKREKRDVSAAILRERNKKQRLEKQSTSTSTPCAVQGLAVAYGYVACRPVMRWFTLRT